MPEPGPGADADRNPRRLDQRRIHREQSRPRRQSARRSKSCSTSAGPDIPRRGAQHRPGDQSGGDQPVGNLPSIQNNRDWLRQAQRFPIIIGIRHAAGRSVQGQLRIGGPDLGHRLQGRNQRARLLGKAYIRVASWPVLCLLSDSRATAPRRQAHIPAGSRRPRCRLRSPTASACRFRFSPPVRIPAHEPRPRRLGLKACSACAGRRSSRWAWG